MSTTMTLISSGSSQRTTSDCVWQSRYQTVRQGFDEYMAQVRKTGKWSWIKDKAGDWIYIEPEEAKRRWNAVMADPKLDKIEIRNAEGYGQLYSWEKGTPMPDKVKEAIHEGRAAIPSFVSKTADQPPQPEALKPICTTAIKLPFINLAFTISLGSTPYADESHNLLSTDRSVTKPKKLLKVKPFQKSIFDKMFLRTGK